MDLSKVPVESCFVSEIRYLLLLIIYVFPANSVPQTKRRLLLGWFGRGSLARNRKSHDSPDAIRYHWPWTCYSFEGPQIRLSLNSATYPLTMCQKSLRDRIFGTCSLDEFVKANSYSTSIHFHDKTWNASCVVWFGHGAFTGHTGSGRALMTSMYM